MRLQSSFTGVPTVTLCRRVCRAAFTLLQLLLSMFLVAVLAALVMGTVERAIERTHSSECDRNLKAIALALDAYRQEYGKYPAVLTQLETAHFITDPNLMHCPDDPRPTGTYADFYALRGPHDDQGLPVVICPFHEEYHQGAQVFLGRYAMRYAAAPARLTLANNVTVTHPGSSQAVSAVSGMALHGGDQLSTGFLGSCTISFLDGSTAQLQGNCNVTVLQSFIDGQSSGPLYTLFKQTLGTVKYEVHHGSKFDVVTPTATAGARGTAFQIRIDANGRTNLLVTSGTVTLTTNKRTGIAPNNLWVTDLDIMTLPLVSGLLNLL